MKAARNSEPKTTQLREQLLQAAVTHWNENHNTKRGTNGGRIEAPVGGIILVSVEHVKRICNRSGDLYMQKQETNNEDLESERARSRRLGSWTKKAQKKRWRMHHTTRVEVAHRVKAWWWQKQGGIEKVEDGDDDSRIRKGKQALYEQFAGRVPN